MAAQMCGGSALSRNLLPSATRGIRLPTIAEARSNTWYRDALTRLAALGTLSRKTGEGLADVRTRVHSRTTGEGDPAPTGPRGARPEDRLQAGWVRANAGKHPFDFDH